MKPSDSWCLPPPEAIELQLESPGRVIEGLGAADWDYGLDTHRARTLIPARWPEGCGIQGPIPVHPQSASPVTRSWDEAERSSLQRRLLARDNHEVIASAASLPNSRKTALTRWSYKGPYKPLQASLQTVSLTSVMTSNRIERGSSATKSAQILMRSISFRCGRATEANPQP